MNMHADIPTPAASPVVGRFAPTPSGRMHLGNVFSCLMSWLAVRSAGGCMVCRIEDLDPRAQSRERAELLLDDLRWLGLDWDGEVTYQSMPGHAERYAAVVERLRKKGLAYPCFCTRAELHAATAPHASDGTFVYTGTCRGLSADEVRERSRVRPPALRLRVPGEGDPAGTIAVDDLVYGHHVEVLARDCGDFMIVRSDGVYAYQLAVVVDDGDAGVNLVVRGHDLLGSSARQTYLARLLGYAPPAYGHVPLLVAPDGRRLSKRDRDLDLGVLREAGVRPEHIVSVLAQQVGLLSPGEEASAVELVPHFSWDALRCHRDDIPVDDAFLRQLYG